MSSILISYNFLTANAMYVCDTESETVAHWAKILQLRFQVSPHILGDKRKLDVGSSFQCFNTT